MILSPRIIRRNDRLKALTGRYPVYQSLHPTKGVSSLSSVSFTVETEVEGVPCVVTGRLDKTDSIDVAWSKPQKSEPACVADVKAKEKALNDLSFYADVILREEVA